MAVKHVLAESSKQACFGNAQFSLQIKMDMRMAVYCIYPFVWENNDACRYSVFMRNLCKRYLTACSV